MKKKILPLILVCCALAALFAVSASAEIVNSGECGDNVKWTLDSKGNLTINGTGAIWNQSGQEYRNSSSVIISLTVGNGVTEIGENAFSGLDRLAKVSLPDSLTRIHGWAFYGCSSLTKITLPDSISAIEDSVFYGCSNLLSFTIPDNVNSIGNNSFADCDHLTSIVIPQNVESMSGSAFYGCDRLKSITILGEIPVIKTSTFYSCPALTEVTIPDSVLIVEDSAFYGCDALTDVHYTGTEDMWKEISVDANNQPLVNAKIHANTSPEDAYRINGITVSGGTKGTGAIPQGSFLATVSITNRASSANPMICLVAYSKDGKFQDFVYVTVKEPVGGTVEVTLPVDNSSGNITELKAFAVKSSSNMQLIGNSISFS